MGRADGVRARRDRGAGLLARRSRHGALILENLTGPGLSTSSNMAGQQ